MAVVNLGNGNDLWEAFQQGLGGQPNTINAGGGDDIIISGGLNDTVNGEDGNDSLFGVSGNDILNGGAGDDTLKGGNGSDTMTGGTGVDTYILDMSNELGQDIISDNDGILKVGISTFVIDPPSVTTTAYTLAGTPVHVSGNLYTLTVNDLNNAPVTYNIQWSGVNGTDLIIWTTSLPQATSSLTIQNFNDNTFGISFVAPNVAPTAADDSANVVEDSVAGVVINVLANDTDTDGTLNPASVAIGTNPAHGTVTINTTTGAITYIPTAGYVGADSFTYTVLDNNGAVSNAATVTLNVTDSAIHLTNNPDFFEAFSQGLGNQNIEIYGENGNDVIITGFGNDYIEGGEGNDTLYSYNGNDTVKGGAGNDTIEAGSGINVVEGGTGDDTFVIGFSGAGTTSITDNGGALFLGTINPSTGQPVGVAFTGTATQTTAGNYALTIGANTYNLAWTGGNLVITQTNGTNPHVYTVNNYVNGAFGLNLVIPNATPVANNDSANVTEDSTTGVVINVLANDTDSDGTLNATTVTIGTNPAHGTVSVNATTGAVTYIPTAGYVGADSFTYTVLDNTGAVSNTATVTLNVTDSAIHLTNNPDFFEAFSQGLGNQNIEIYGENGNDVIITGFGNDYIEGGNGNDTLYSYNGNDTVKGGDGNDTIEAGSGTNVVEGGTGDDTFVIGFSGAGTTQITDNGGALFLGTINPSTGQPVGVAFTGTATQTAPGVYGLTIGANTYNLAWTGGNLVITQTNGTNPHVYTVNNYVNGTFGLNLVTPNAAPVANNDSANPIESRSTVINVLTNDTDSDGTINPASVTITGNPAHGTVAVNATTGAVTYTPTVGYIGADSFTYTVLDNTGTVSNTATVTLNVVDNAIYLTNGVDVWEPHSLGLNLVMNEVHGLEGNDVIVGGSVNDELYGDGGNDMLFGNAGADIINGGAGDDVIDGSNAGVGGVNVVAGGTGNDTYVVEFTDTGATSITDDNGALFIGTANFQTGALNGVALAGTATQTAPGVYGLTIGVNTYSLAWTGGNLVITQTNGTAPHVVTVNNFVNGTFGINLVVPNTAPVATNDSASLSQNGSVLINILANDTDADGTLNAGSVSIVGNPAHGTVSVNPTTGAVTYTATAGYTGADTLTYTVLDNNGAVSNTATVNLTVNPVNSDVITLNNNSNFYYGTNNAENVNALGGHDFLYLKAGNDTVSGGAGNDYIDGGEGNDTLNGDAGSDLLYGGNGNDTINGGDDADLVFGGNGDDIISGGNGNDLLFGDNGNDTINGDDGNDTIFGDSGNDILRGGIGNDAIFGGAGNDTIVGGAGRDFMWGNSGSDVFRFDAISDSSAAARDVIEDFTRGQDKLSISSAIATDISGLVIQATFDGVNVTDANSTFSIHLDNVHSLNASDFIFS